MKSYNTLTPYEVVDYKGIQYTTCTEYGHISRYKGLRQIIHNPDEPDRFITLETPNAFSSSSDVVYYDVSATEENRLDIIADKFLGSSRYAWILAYFNVIEDGFTVRDGQRLRMPKSIYSLFNKGELLSPISPLQLNLGSE